MPNITTNHAITYTNWQEDFMSSNSVCNQTRDYHSYDYRPNWTPLSPIIITYRILKPAMTKNYYKNKDVSLR